MPLLYTIYESVLPLVLIIIIIISSYRTSSWYKWMTFNLQTRSMTGSGCALKNKNSTCCYTNLWKFLISCPLNSSFFYCSCCSESSVSVPVHLRYSADVFFHTLVHSVLHHHPGNTVLNLTCNLNRRLSLWSAVTCYSHKGLLLYICSTAGTQRSVTLTLKDCHVQSAKWASVAALLILK